MLLEVKEIVDRVKNIMLTVPNTASKVQAFSSLNVDEKKFLESKTKFLTDFYTRKNKKAVSMSERLYCLEHDIEKIADIPKCKTGCHRVVHFLGYEKGYSEFCRFMSCYTAWKKRNPEAAEVSSDIFVDDLSTLKDESIQEDSDKSKQPVKIQEVIPPIVKPIVPPKPVIKKSPVSDMSLEVSKFIYPKLYEYFDKNHGPIQEKLLLNNKLKFKFSKSEVIVVYSENIRGGNSLWQELNKVYCSRALIILFKGSNNFLELLHNRREPNTWFCTNKKHATNTLIEELRANNIILL